MTKTNLEQYKKELSKLFYQEYGNPAAIFGKIKTGLDSNIRSNYGETYMYDVLDWMSQPCKEHILDEVERKYLLEVIRPFKDNVVGIIKLNYMNDFRQQYISIAVTTKRGFRERINLPIFNFNTMYKGMETNKLYTLKELGL